MTCSPQLLWAECPLLREVLPNHCLRNDHCPSPTHAFPSFYPVLSRHGSHHLLTLPSLCLYSCVFLCSLSFLRAGACQDAGCVL